MPNTVKLWGRSLLLLTALSGCSYVPDAANPVEWYKGTRDFITGKDEPEPASTTAASKSNTTADNRKDTPQGLSADRSNAQYAEPVRREVTPTRPLAKRTPTTEQTQVAAASAPSAQQTTATSATPIASTQLPPQQAQALARADEGPDAPPASINMTPPPPADIPETVPVPGRPKRLQQQFEKRLAESAQQTVRPGIVDMPGSSHLAYADEAPIHLVPPSAGKKAKSAAGGGKGMAAPLPAPQPAASFQVASVDFESDATLSASDRAAIAEVARLYKQTKGVVRVIGYAPAPGFGGMMDPVGQVMGGLEASQQRADAVARELNRRGVPASKILVAADPSFASAGQGGAQIFLDVM